MVDSRSGIITGTFSDRPIITARPIIIIPITAAISSGPITVRAAFATGATTIGVTTTGATIAGIITGIGKARGLTNG
jgi:hypothetical protein